MKSIVEFLNSQSDIVSSPVIWKPISSFDDKDPERKTSDSFIRSVLDQILGDSRCASVIRYLDFDPSKIPDREESLGMLSDNSQAISRYHISTGHRRHG